ncbi:cysteine-rich RLK (RECEPTOR-like protein kinase) 8 [Striga hermonthica]|uniref:Cysteine-rich RLK (RECEPTOR-like protein kinase) 8 n=1 Tax=Striga hermonthica TaxID=68872 RepID=A0A9N7MZW2_STRHE|nr:cysteine-rich RLK (RECEPTOR-like protein kinase) 8 [Striga hermonthica]
MADESGSSATTGGGTEEFHNSDLSTLLRLLRQQQPTPVTTTNKQYQSVSIAVKLDEFNFSVWSRLMRMAIGGRGSLSHITGNPPPPLPEDPEYTNWEQEDLKVQSDIIHNLSSDLVALYVEFPTARDLWNGLNETYSTGRDYLQLFDLKRQANNIKQEDGTIETYHGILSRGKNQAKKSGAATAALGDAEATSKDGSGEGTALMSSGGLSGEQGKRPVGEGIRVRGKNLPTSPLISNPRYFYPGVFDIDASDSPACSFYKSVPIATEKFNLNPPSNFGTCAIIKNEKCSEWILDSGASDTMTFDPGDFVARSGPHRQSICDASGAVAAVGGAGTIEITKNLHLKNCLYIPSLSFKLLSVSHVTKELDCYVLMAPTFCLLQDIRTGTLIGCGIERDGLYYVEEVTQPGVAALAHGSSERQAWLWHRRLGHPSVGYLRSLFPHVFPTFDLFLREKGITHQTTCPYTPQQNGVAERKNRLILEMTCAMLIESQSPTFLWPEAVATSVYLLNRLPTKALAMSTPLDALSTMCTLPSVLSLEPRVFGCTVFIHVPKIHRTKFSPCSVKCVFVGYGKSQKGYRCYDPATRQIHVTLDCHFLETEYFYASQLSGQGEKVNDSLTWLMSSSSGGTTRNAAEEPIVQSTPHSLSGDPSPSPPVSPPMSPSYISTQSSDGPNPSLEVSRDIPGNTVDEETGGADEHVDVLPERYVLPPRHNRGVPAKRYEPEHVPKTTKYPVANYVRGSETTMAQAFSLAICSVEIPRNVEEAQEQELWQKAMDLEMEALVENGTWEKCQLPRRKKVVGCRWVYTSFAPNEVCRLKKSLYGLKQSPRAWFGRFTQAMKKYGYRQSHSDHTLFLKRRKGYVTCLIIYVDDMILTGDDKEEMARLPSQQFGPSSRPPF